MMDDITNGNACDAQDNDPIAAMALSESIRAKNASEAIEKNEAEERRALTEKQSKKRTTVIFMIAASVVEIVLSLLCIMVLYVGFGVVIYRVIGATTSAPLELSSPVIFIAGVVFGYQIYKRIMRLIIDKMSLKDRLNPNVYEMYLTRKEQLKRKYTR